MRDPGMTHSGIYQGKVYHRRLSPRDHQFSYPMFMMYLDLDELPELFEKSRLFSARGRALAQFRREDHLGDPGIPLDQAVRELVEKETGQRPVGPIRLLTQLRYFSYVFNPVSFYYCYKQDGKNLDCVVAEVNNTPWGEQHCYVLGSASEAVQHSANGPGLMRWKQAKKMHVSPFMPMDMDYEWRMSPPGSRLGIYMQNRRAGEKVFDATLKLKRQEITAASLRNVILRFPFMTLQVMFAIHWQALRLWLKKVPVYDHPGKQAPAKPKGQLTDPVPESAQQPGNPIESSPT
jgi:DUF1365 family protein